jgi:hypothetical protein
MADCDELQKRHNRRRAGNFYGSRACCVCAERALWQIGCSTMERIFHRKVQQREIHAKCWLFYHTDIYIGAAGRSFVRLITPAW